MKTFAAQNDEILNILPKLRSIRRPTIRTTFPEEAFCLRCRLNLKLNFLLDSAFLREGVFASHARKVGSLANSKRSVLISDFMRNALRGRTSESWSKD